MPHQSRTDISMRYLPDLSDITFQIPVVDDDMLTRGGFELTYDALDDSELGGLDADPFQTPIPKSKQHDPLTLSELTPNREGVGREATTNVTKAGASSFHRQVTENVGQAQSSVRPPFSKKESVDDMFERRKRDSYQQMGLDLTSKSTARLRRALDDNAKNSHSETDTRTDLSQAHKITEPDATRDYDVDAPKGTNKRRVMGNHAGIVKHKPPSSSAQSIRPKSILKPSKPASPLPMSTLSRTLTALSRTPKVERPKWDDVVAEAQRTSRDRESGGNGMGLLGGGLIDVLAMYGEKLKGSLGFSSGNTAMTSSNVADTQPVDNRDMNSLQDTSRAPGPSSESLTPPGPRPWKLDDFRRVDPLTLSELSPSRRPLNLSSHANQGNVQPYPTASPMRPPKKRELRSTPRRQRKKSRVNSIPPLETSKSSSPIRGDCQPAEKAALEVKALGPSRVANRPHENVEPLRSQPSSTKNIVTLKVRPLATGSSASLKGKRIEAKIGHRRAADAVQHASTSSTMSSGPVVAKDVYRQRTLEKEHAERKKREQKQKRTFEAGTIPHFTKPAPPARPTVHPTVPVAFTFHSDARAAQRNAEFEEKRKTWESRATHHALPIPDFATLHAAQAQAQQARGRRAVPVLPTEGPMLTTMMRAKEREKFERERRERERAMEKLREIREKERGELEEQEYRAARKRTVPKAHEVPEWYKDMPKRKEVE